MIRELASVRMKMIQATSSKQRQTELERLEISAEEKEQPSIQPIVASPAKRRKTEEERLKEHVLSIVVICSIK